MSDLSRDLEALRINRDAPPSGGTGGVVRTLTVLAVVVGAGAGLYKYALPEIEASLYKIEVQATEISRVSPAQASVDLTSTGYIVPERTAKISSLVAGRIIKIQVNEGQKVDHGQTLFEIDLADQRAASQTLRARAIAAEARASATRAQANEIQVQLDRENSLFTNGATTKAVVDDLSARLKSAHENANAALAEAKAAQADFQASTTPLRHAIVRAPIDGTVIGKPPQLGDVLAVGGPTLFEIVDLTSLVVEADVPEARLALAKPGAPTEIVLDSAPNDRKRGEVLAITPRVNRSKATVAVKIKFIDSPTTLFPEMSARVSFLTKPLDAEAMKAPPKTIVPASAVVDRNGGKVVYVIDGGRVRVQTVSLGDSFGDGFELLQGPSVGTRLVRTPPPTLADNKPIKEKSER